MKNNTKELVRLRKFLFKAEILLKTFVWIVRFCVSLCVWSLAPKLWKIATNTNFLSKGITFFQQIYLERNNLLTVTEMKFHLKYYATIIKTIQIIIFSKKNMKTVVSTLEMLVKTQTLTKLLPVNANTWVYQLLVYVENVHVVNVSKIDICPFKCILLHSKFMRW